MYTLILTIVPKNGTPVVHTIPGFLTRDDAGFAGVEWCNTHIQLSHREGHSFEFTVAYMG